MLGIRGWMSSYLLLVCLYFTIQLISLFYQFSFFNTIIACPCCIDRIELTMYSDSSLSNGDGCEGCAKILMNEKRLSGETITSDYGELTTFPSSLPRLSQS
jgi:hypothetical protein